MYTLLYMNVCMYIVGRDWIKSWNFLYYSCYHQGKNIPSDCEQCMYQMLAKWLNKENGKCIRSWRSLCQALYSVDRATADQIAEKHHLTPDGGNIGGRSGPRDMRH